MNPAAGPSGSPMAPLAPDLEKVRIISQASALDRQIIDTPPVSLKMLRMGVKRQFLPYYWYLPPKWKLGLRLLQSKRMPPAFVSLGAARSGTTMLADYIMQHPCVVLPLAKEFAVSSYASKRLLFSQFPSVKEQKEVEQRYGMAVTGYCAPAVPNLMFPHLLSGIAGDLDLRFVLILRNPVDRTFAHWRWEMLLSRRSADQRMMAGVPTFDELMAMEVDAARSAATSGSTFLSGAMTGGFIQNSIYLPFLKTMGKFWDRDRMMVINADDFFAEPQTVARRVYEFLGLPAYDPVELSVRNAGVPGKMQPETRKLLEEFFAPLNRELFEFLGTDYGWR